MFARLALVLGAFIFALQAHAAEKSSPEDVSPPCPRIVSQSPYLTYALTWLSRGECIVGVSRYDREYPDLPRTGGVLDPDQLAIAKVRPDLIVTSNWVEQATMEAVTPKGARFLRVDGFGSMRDVEEMLQTLARESNAPAAAQDKIADFSRQWRAIAQSLSSKGEKQSVLILSSCMGNPYSFGRQHLVGDIFAQAGFEIAETAPKIRHLIEGEEIPTIEALIDLKRPNLVVTFTRESAEYCRAIVPPKGTDIISLDGGLFTHPGPSLLRAWEAVRGAAHGD